MKTYRDVLETRIISVLDNSIEYKDKRSPTYGHRVHYDINKKDRIFIIPYERTKAFPNGLGIAGEMRTPEKDKLKKYLWRADIHVKNVGHPYSYREISYEYVLEFCDNIFGYKALLNGIDKKEINNLINKYYFYTAEELLEDKDL